MIACANIAHRKSRYDDAKSVVYQLGQTSGRTYTKESKQ